MLTLLQLEYFRMLARSEQLNETANQMFVSPSTISTSIRNLEEELGVTLFERPGRHIRLNEQGRLFLDYVEQVFSLLEEGKKTVEITRSHDTEKILVAVPETLKLGGVFGKYLANNPTKKIVERRYTCFHEEIERPEKSDFFITVENLSKQHAIDFRPLLEVPMRLVVRKDHPLAEKGVCSLSELTEETFILRPGNDCFQQQICEVFRNFSFKPSKTHIFDAATSSKMVKSGVGITIDIDKKKAMKRHAACVLTTVKIREFEDSEKGKFSIVGCWEKVSGLSPAASGLMDQIAVAMRNYYLYDSNDG